MQPCRAEDVCAFFSTSALLSSLLNNLPPGADVDACAASLHDATPVCQLQCATAGGAYRYVSGAGTVTCDASDLVPGSNSQPVFTYTGTLSCEDLSGGLAATELHMEVDLSGVTAGAFFPANVTVRRVSSGSVLPVLDGEACAELMATPSDANSWAYLRAAEVQTITLTAVANYSEHYVTNPADSSEVLPATPEVQADGVALNVSLGSGTFALRLQHKRVTEETPQIAWNASAADVQAALQELEQVGNSEHYDC
jgi:hypothetical protein